MKINDDKYPLLKFPMFKISDEEKHVLIKAISIMKLRDLKYLCYALNILSIECPDHEVFICEILKRKIQDSILPKVYLDDAILSVPKIMSMTRIDQRDLRSVWVDRLIEYNNEL